jgi:molybdate transport system substrate-binding protein
MNTILTLLLAALLQLSATARAAEINVFAAASLSDVFTELAPQFTAATGHTLRFNFGASGALARQIKEGAPADAIFSADELRVDQLEKAGLLLPGTRRTLLANSLVVVVGIEGDAPVSTVDDLKKAGVRRIAIGEPATVPVGTYTKEHLQTTKLWSQVIDKCVPLDTVRAVLAAVESGNADAGFVYKTDALISKKVRIAFEIPRESGPSITYPGAVLKDARQPAAATAFLDWLAGPTAQTAFAKYGFVPVQ